MKLEDAMDTPHLKEPVAHKLPLSDEVIENLAIHHLARKIVVKCPGCPFDYALTVPEDIWVAGKTDYYRDSLLEFLKRTDCGRHPSHIVWTRGVPFVAGQLRPRVEASDETELQSKKTAASSRTILAVDHLYLTVRCSGWACNNLIFLCHLGPVDEPDRQHSRPRRFEVTCPACTTVATYSRTDLEEVRAQEPPADWIDHPSFVEHSASTS